jgi:SsrA-binding protein
MSSLIEHKKAHFDYEILEKFEAGMELFGFEVKALRAKQGSLEGSFVGVRGKEAYLIGAHIPAYQPKNAPKSYDPDRTRKLLLTKKELNQLVVEESKKGLTIIPISVYNKGRFIKISFGVARKKKKFDKRQVTKKREADREIHRSLKNE